MKSRTAMPNGLSFSRVLSVLVLSIVLTTSSDARADFWGWVTDLVTQPSEHPEEVSRGMVLPPDAIVAAPGEVRTIELGRDILELHPSTAVTIKTTVGGVTTVQVITGTVRAKVAKRRSQSFKVETPMLVATVKGTVFEVSTTDSASAVAVYGGRVAVKAKGSVGGVDVIPGKTATVTDADREPSLSKTPEGGAAAAARAVSRKAKSSATGDQAGENDKGNDRPREASRNERAPSRGGSGSSGNGSGGATGGGNSSGGDDGDDGGDGEGGESGDGEGGDDD